MRNRVSATGIVPSVPSILKKKMSHDSVPSGHLERRRLFHVLEIEGSGGQEGIDHSFHHLRTGMLVDFHSY